MGWGSNTAYLGGSFLLLILVKRFTRGQSASSSDQAVEEHENIDATQKPKDGVSERTIDQRGLENEEPKMPDHLPGTEVDCSLIKWLRQREDNGIKPLATFEIQGMPTQTYIRDEIKLLIQSLIQSVQDLHSQGQCLSRGTFLAKNIYVVGGKWRFDKVELSSLTEKLQLDDYNSIESMITMVILREEAEQLPHDMQHLLKLLKNPRYHIYMYEELDVKGGKYNDGDDKVNLIRFLRNAAAHLSEQSRRGKRFQFEHINLIITATFPTVLADLQQRLHHYEILQEFL